MSLWFLQSHYLGQIITHISYFLISQYSNTYHNLLKIVNSSNVLSYTISEKQSSFSLQFSYPRQSKKGTYLAQNGKFQVTERSSGLVQFHQVYVAILPAKQTTWSQKDSHKYIWWPTMLVWLYDNVLVNMIRCLRWM